MKARAWTLLFSLAVHLGLPRPAVLWLDRRASHAMGMRAEDEIDDMDAFVEAD